MSEGRSWRGDWKARLHERVRERGYSSLSAFAEARPAISLVALAEELGEDDINAVQVFTGLLAEAMQRRQVSRLERDMLARELSEGLPHGWPAILDDVNRFEVAKALSAWISFTPEPHQERARKISAALLASPPPPGWRPLGPDDALLRTLLPDEEA